MFSVFSRSVFSPSPLTSFSFADKIKLAPAHSFLFCLLISPRNINFSKYTYAWATVTRSMLHSVLAILRISRFKLQHKLKSRKSTPTRFTFEVCSTWAGCEETSPWTCRWFPFSSQRASRSRSPTSYTTWKSATFGASRRSAPGRLANWGDKLGRLVTCRRRRPGAGSPPSRANWPVCWPGRTKRTYDRNRHLKTTFIERFQVKSFRFRGAWGSEPKRFYFKSYTLDLWSTKLLANMIKKTTFVSAFS